MNELITYLVEASLYAGLAYVLYLWVRRYTSYHVQRFWLLFGLGFSLLVPFIEISIPTAMTTYSLQLPEIYMNEVEIGQTTSGRTIYWPNILFWIYSVGVFVAGLRFMYGFLPIMNWLTNGKRKEEEGIEFILHPRVEVPFSFGPFLFWNPHWNYTEEQRKMILIHEGVHIRRQHTWDLLILQLMKILAWFHPLVYLYESALKDIHEYEADQATLTNYKRKEYIELLLQHLFRARWVPGHSIFQSPIQKRIKMMKTNKVQSTNMRMMALALVLMFSSVLYLGCSETTVDSNEAIAKEEKEVQPNFSEKENSEDVFKKVEEMPRFPGCDNMKDKTESAECSQKNMINWIMNQIEYPEDALKNNASGKVVVKFVVDKEGKILNPTLVKDIGHGMGEEVLRVVNNMNDMEERWTPGKQRGKAVNVELHLPVNFQLSEN